MGSRRSEISLKLKNSGWYEMPILANNISFRIHSKPIHETFASLRSQRDCAKHTSPISGYEGGLGPRYSFMSVSMRDARNTVVLE